MTDAGATAFSYDPSGGLYDIGAHRLASVGGERLALYTTSGGALHRRIVPGAGFDEAAAYYHGAGTGTRQWPLADQLGSVVAYANASGAAANINTYDEYGRPGPGNAGFLQYTGQLAIASAPGVYNYRNRFYVEIMILPKRPMEAVEVKTGNGGFTPAQLWVYGRLRSGGLVIGHGANASLAGMGPGTSGAFGRQGITVARYGSGSATNCATLASLSKF